MSGGAAAGSDVLVPCPGGEREELGVKRKGKLGANVELDREREEEEKEGEEEEDPILQSEVRGQVVSREAEERERTESAKVPTSTCVPLLRCLCPIVPAYSS